MNVKLISIIIVLALFHQLLFLVSNGDCWVSTDGLYVGRDIPFDWIDARLGTLIYLEGDDWISVRYYLPFDIKFYGKFYSYLVISTNGLLSFQLAGTTSRNNSSLPDPNPPNSIICPFWDNLVLEKKSIYVYYDPEREILVIQWDDVTDYPSLSDSLTFQAQFFKTGEIRFMYAEMVGTIASGSTASIGIENEDGTMGIQYENTGIPGPVSSGFGLSFTPIFAISSIQTAGKVSCLLLMGCLTIWTMFTRIP